MTLITRELKCPACAAPHEASPDAQVLICGYCGAFMVADSADLLEGEGWERYREEALKRLAAGEWANERKTALLARMEEAQRREDREGWRPLAHEYWSLMAATDPQLTLGEDATPARLAAWLQRAAKRDEILKFDPEAKRAYAAYVQCTGGFMTAKDPVACARTMLKAADAYSRAVLQHPDHPDGVTGEEQAQYGKDLVRAYVTALQHAFTQLPDAVRPAGFGKKVFARIFVEVLGDHAAEGGTFSCGNCGAALAPAQRESGRCPFCGGRIVVRQ